MGIIAKKKIWTLTIQEGLPDDIYKQAARALGEGIINDDFLTVSANRYHHSTAFGTIVSLESVPS